MKKLKALLLIGFCTLIFGPASGQPNSPDGLTYKTGFSTMMKLGSSLYSQLKPKDQEFVSIQPISIDVDLTPFVRMLYYPQDPKPIRGVWISAGFIDLVNHVAHAKAIDLKKKGYFNSYIQQLAQENGEKELKPIPNETDPSFWTESMLNEQESNFNSIVGIVVGIKLAHHYLGHYDKYKARLSDENGSPPPIENLVSPEEWEAAFKKGVRNALDAGCLVEGVIPFYEAFDKMTKRPPWTIYFLPEGVKFSKIKKEMEQIQKRFLAGQP
jgi:hypothetical protein